MKVLAISASPRKGGNSDVLCDQFLKGAAEKGHTVEKIRLAEYKIGPCLACEACAATGKCVQKDEMESILAALIDADVIVLATPVYFYSMDAQLKTMIDRTLPRYTEIRDKDFYCIVTAADPAHAAADETLAGIDGFLRCLPGSERKGVVYGAGTWKRKEVYDHPSFQQAYEMGKTV